MPVRQNGGSTPAQSQHSEAEGSVNSFISRPTKIFEWYENRIESDLQRLYRAHANERQYVSEIIEELNDSNMFWKLHASYTNASEGSKKEDDGHDALMALLARVYIAGSLRGHAVMEL